MLNCKETSELASRSLDTKLSLHEHARLLIHLAACKLCRRYLLQLRFMQRAIAKQRRAVSTSLDPQLPAQARKRIQAEIDKHR
ncbi:MAG: zf-HC2 domain-containing protein [Gammaproteobacteria bacterium]|nr:zf-HC2 domain-containing protein [Gammaproteobacteria bacterium]